MAGPVSDETNDLGRRNRELSVLNEVARELNRSVNPSEARPASATLV